LAEGVHLMKAADFTRFLFGGKTRDDLEKKLKLPVLT
jgi:hypothetical protein